MKLAFVFLIVLGSLTAAGFAIRYSLRRERKFRDEWRAIAAKRRFRWIEPFCRWYRRGNPRMEGEHEGVALALERYFVSNGKAQIPFTRARVELPRVLDERLVTCRRRWLERMSTAFRGPLVEIGDREYDARMLVRCRSAHEARTLLDDSVRARILAAPRALSVECAEREAKVFWRGSETDSNALDAALSVAAALHRALAR